jgi:aspartyl protease family protein
LGNRFIWVLLIGLVIGLLTLLAQQGEDSVLGMSGSDLGSLIGKIAILVVLGGAAMLMFRDNFAKAVQAALFWVVVALVLVAGYTYRFELREVSDRVLTELIPGRAYSKGRVVEVARGRSGAFALSTSINGTKIPMALDTGASAVVLTYEAAKAAGLPLEMLSYNVNVDTANGRTKAASVTLDKVGVGGVIERAVPALIAQPGALRTNLLGMSFLNRLESWEVRGDKLIMRGYP